MYLGYGFGTLFSVNVIIILTNLKKLFILLDNKLIYSIVNPDYENEMVERFKK